MHYTYPSFVIPAPKVLRLANRTPVTRVRSRPCIVRATWAPLYVCPPAQAYPAHVRYINTVTRAPNAIIDEDFALALKKNKPSVSEMEPRRLISDVDQRQQSVAERREVQSVATERDIRVYRNLGVATLAGFVIGTERASAKSLAGVRTCSLVSLGSAIFFCIALMYPGAKVSEGLSRAATAQISAVGFLGASVLTR